jgi:hypothetical protein
MIAPGRFSATCPPISKGVPHVPSSRHRFSDWIDRCRGNRPGDVHDERASPVLYVSNSNPWNDIDVAGEIYKMHLDGTIVGKFGRAGKLPKEFGRVNSIDCRSENTLYVGEIGNLRVQKLELH